MGFRMIAAALAALLAAAAPAGAEITPRGALPDWMEGTWLAVDGSDWSDQLWTDARGGMMLGFLRAGFGPDLQSWETAQIRRRPDGTIGLVLREEGRQPVEFALAVQSEQAVEFANPANPYPQRLRWSRQGKLLTLELSRIDGSDARSWNFRPVIPPQDE